MSTSSSGRSTTSSHPSDNDWDKVEDTLEATLQNLEENMEQWNFEIIPSSARASDDEWVTCSASSETAAQTSPPNSSSDDKPVLKTFSSSATQAEQALGCLREALIYHIVNCDPQNRSHEDLTRAIHSVLKDHKLSPTEIISFLQTLPPPKGVYTGLYVYVDEDRHRLNVASREADYGDKYDLDCPGGKTLVEDVLALCVDAYMDIDLSEERIDGTSRSGNMAERAGETSEESEMHATPEDNPSSSRSSDDEWKAVSASRCDAAVSTSPTPAESSENDVSEDEFFCSPGEKAQFLLAISKAILNHTAQSSSVEGRVNSHSQISDMIFDAVGPLESHEIIHFICTSVLPAPAVRADWKDWDRWLDMGVGMEAAEKEFYSRCRGADERLLGNAFADCVDDYLLNHRSTESKEVATEGKACKPREKFETNSTTSRFPEKEQKALERILEAFLGHLRSGSVSSHLTLAKAIYDGLAYDGINASQIADFTRVASRIFVPYDRDGHRRIVQKTRNMANYGDRYLLNCVDGETLVAEVLKSCLDAHWELTSTESKDEITPTSENTRKQAAKSTCDSTKHTWPPFPDLDTQASVPKSETDALAKRVNECIPAELLQSIGVATIIRDILNYQIQESNKKAKDLNEIIPVEHLPTETVAIIWNVLNEPIQESKSASPPLIFCQVHGIKRCACYYSRARIAAGLKRKFLKLGKENAVAWKELDAENAKKLKVGVSGGYHFAKLESCVPLLVKESVSAKGSEKSKNKDIMTFAAYVASDADKEKKAPLTNEQFAKMLVGRPLKWKVGDEMKETRTTKSPPVASLKSQVATKPIMSFQPFPTKQFERMLTEHIHAPVATKEFLSSSTAPSAAKTDTDKETSHRQATSSVPSPHLSPATSSKTPSPEPDTDSEDIWESDDEEAYLSDSTTTTPQRSKADTPKQSTFVAPPRPKGYKAAAFLFCGVDASGETPPGLAIILLLLFVISSFILLLQNGEQIFDSVAPVFFSYILPIVGAFWSAVGLVIKAPFLILGWVFAFFAAVWGVIVGGGGVIPIVPASVVPAPVAEVIFAAPIIDKPAISTVTSTITVTITSLPTPEVRFQDSLPSTLPISAI